jgi:hypothetical protein
MADPLSTEQAKTALANVVRGRSRRPPRPTTREAKEKLRQLAKAPTLLDMARTQPILAVAVAIGYGIVLGSGRTDRGKLAGYLDRVLTHRLSNNDDRDAS